MTTPSMDAAPGDGLQVDLVRGTPTAEELAALIAVVSEEYGRQEETATVADAPGPSAWQVSARRGAGPLHPELGWLRGGR